MYYIILLLLIILQSFADYTSQRRQVIREDHSVRIDLFNWTRGGLEFLTGEETRDKSLTVQVEKSMPHSTVAFQMKHIVTRLIPKGCSAVLPTVVGTVQHISSTLPIHPRFFSSTPNNNSNNNTNKPSQFPFIPEPTWSVADLELDQQHAPVSEQELRKLAKRALLDMDQLDDNTRQQLRQDVGNMMHMLAQVQSFDFGEESTLTDADIYDKPRGVTKAPLRKDAEEANEKDKRRDDKVAENVYKSFLQPNTIQVGAFDYFSIETKRETKKK